MDSNEAERIVQQFQVDTLGVAASPGYVASEEYLAHRRLLVAVLAAVIEETDAEEALDVLKVKSRKYGKVAAVQRLDSARQSRREALSALRAREKPE